MLIECVQKSELRLMVSAVVTKESVRRMRTRTCAASEEQRRADSNPACTQALVDLSCSDSGRKLQAAKQKSSIVLMVVRTDSGQDEAEVLVQASK